MKNQINALTRCNNYREFITHSISGNMFHVYFAFANELERRGIDLSDDANICFYCKDNTYFMAIPDEKIILRLPVDKRSFSKHPKTKKGKVKSHKKGRDPFAPLKKAILKASIIVLMGAGALATSHTKSKEVPNEIESLEETKEYLEAIKDVNIVNENVVMEQGLSNLETIEETQAEKIVPSIEIVEQNLNLSVDARSTDPKGMDKREETIVFFGDDIKLASERYGIDYKLLVGLFTQERPNIPDHLKKDLTEKKYSSFGSEQKKILNIGQLTQSMCGEEIIAPVIDPLSGKTIAMDKYFILPACYDGYPLEDLSTMGNFSKFSEMDQKKIQKAIKFQNEGGWNIVKRGDIFYNPSKNIRVASAYLAYLIDKKEDLFKGVLAHHTGYSALSSSLTYDNMFRGEHFEAYDPQYLVHILKYLHPEERLDLKCVIKGKLQIYRTTTLDMENTYEKENGHHL